MPQIEDFYETVVREYGKIDPRDRQDTEAHLSAATAQAVAALVSLDAKIDAEGATLFGLRTRRDDSIPFGRVRFVTENAEDRAIRRAAKDGLAVNVMKLEALPPLMMPAPEPTLRALLRHWLRRLR